VHEGAGGAAARRADHARGEASALRERAVAGLRAAPRVVAAGAAGHRVAATLGALTGAGRPWRLLTDRRLPGSQALPVDLVLVGPPGVFVVGVQRFTPRPEPGGGRLFAGGGHGAPGGGAYGTGVGRNQHVAALAAVADHVEYSVQEIGLCPLAVAPVLVLDGHRLDTRLGQVHLLGTADLLPALLRLPTRLSSDSVDTVTAHLAASLPAAPRRAGGAPPTTSPPSAASAASPAELFAVEEVAEALRVAEQGSPLEGWMTFLRPAQVALVRRHWAGPAHLVGAAGTGKSVVALHRAAQLARRDGARVLFVTCANALPRVLGAALRRMAGPSVADRVEITSLADWATRFLGGHGLGVTLDGRRSRTALRAAWTRTGRVSTLTDVCDDPRYWWDEIEYVIKANGVTSVEQYARLRRHGRHTVLRARQREAVWRLYEDYERLLAAAGVADRHDLITAAADEVRRTPPSPAYTAVIADEAQDLSPLALRLLHALVGDRPDGLLLVGDGAQAVYPGSAGPQEAGIDVRGRVEVLRTNHRSTREIVAASRELVAGAGDGPTGHGGGRPGGAVVVARGGPRPRRVVAPDAASHDRALLAAVGELLPGVTEGDRVLVGYVPPRRQDAAVLCASAADADRYAVLLRDAGIPTLPLHRYDGSADGRDGVGAVKIGTYLAAKGLEFGHVFLPHSATGATGHPPAPHLPAPPATPPTTVVAGAGVSVRGAGAAAVSGEIAALERRRRYVGMTRARESLWIGVVRPPAPTR